MAYESPTLRLSSENDNGYANLSFVPEEHVYGKINSYSVQRCSTAVKYSFFHGKSRVVIAVAVVIVVASAIIVALAVSLTGRNGKTNEANKELDDFWSKWGTWTECSATCGSGFRRRYRICTADISSMCKGDLMESEKCWESECFVYGKWTTWTSYGNCDVSCGGGIQLRTRTCSKTKSSDLDCVGGDLQKRNCSVWECPDCSRICNIGVLNSGCDVCICEKKNATGRVFDSSTGNPVGNADIFYKTAQTESIAASNVTGFFIILDFCPEADVVIKKHGFVDMELKIRESFADIRLNRLDLPRMTKAPETKYRLIGENVTLCCEGSSDPPIIYYEWLKNDILMGETMYENVSEVRLTNLTINDDGIYQCRVNSESGAIMSPPAKLTVKEKSEEFCANALQPKNVDLPFDCVQPGNITTFEVGECVNTKCRPQNALDEGTCGDSKHTCCSTGNASLETVNCSGYQLNLLVVKSCTCSLCESNSIQIRGFLRGFASMKYISFGKIFLDGNLKKYANSQGYFEFSVSQPNTRLTIRVEDNYLNQYLPATKVLDIRDASGVLDVDISMIRIANPSLVVSDQDISLDSGIASPDEQNIQLALQANSLYTVNGNQYNGTANAHLTFLNSGNISNVDSLPGRFQFVDEDGQNGNLESLGVFNIFFEDLSGNPLVVGDVVDVYIPINENFMNVTFFEDFKLWRLNPSSGIWEALPYDPEKRRRKRQSVNTALWIGELKGYDLSKTVWYNVDKIGTRIPANVCYFKVWLYKDDNLTEIVAYPDRNVEINQHMILNNILQSFYDNIFSPKYHCVKTKCDGQTTFISLFYHGRTAAEALFARAPLTNTIRYNISQDERVLQIYETHSSIDGPFYESLSVCYNSTSSQNHLRFSFEQRLTTSYIVSKFVDERDDPSNPTNKSLLAWYQKSQSSNYYPICFAKINIDFSHPVELSPGEILRLRVFSHGGTQEQVKDKPFGLNEEIVTQTSGNASFCIKYKCSGTIELLSEKDFTNVKVDFRYPKSEMRCKIVQQASLLTSIISAMNLVIDNQIGSTNGTFHFFAPEHSFGNVLGLYAKEGMKTDLDTQEIRAENFCRSGSADGTNVNGNFKVPMSNQGPVVTFRCE